MIFVVKKGDPSRGVRRRYRVYVGRPSVLGNPYLIPKHDDRDQVCDLYDASLAIAFDAGGRIHTEIMRLVRMAEDGDLELECYCAPARCHADSIKALIERLLEERA